jgi:hypothetical protein
MKLAFTKTNRMLRGSTVTAPIRALPLRSTTLSIPIGPSPLLQTESKLWKGIIKMNKIANYIVWLVAVAFTAGCASGPDFKTYGSTLNPPKEGKSRVWCYRPSKMMGSAVQPTVYINDSPVAKAQPGCFFFADKPPGTYELKCSTEWADKAQLTVVENRTAYVRLTLLPGVFVGHTGIKKNAHSLTSAAARSVLTSMIFLVISKSRDIPVIGAKEF